MTNGVDDNPFPITMKPHIDVEAPLPEEALRAISTCLGPEEDREVQFIMVYAETGGELRKYLLAPGYKNRMDIGATDIEEQRAVILELDNEYTLTAHVQDVSQDAPSGVARSISSGRRVHCKRNANNRWCYFRR